MAKVFNQQNVVNSISGTTTTPIENPHIDIAKYKESEISNNSQKNAINTLFTKTTGIFEKLRLAKVNLNGIIAKYAGFSIVNKVNSWSFSNMSIDELTYFIIFKTSPPELGDNAYPFQNRFNDCNFIRFTFWNQSGMFITNNDATATTPATKTRRLIKRLHKNGDQELGTVQPSSHIDQAGSIIVPNHYKNKSDYEYFGTTLHNILNDLFFDQNGSGQIGLHHYILGQLENPYPDKWVVFNRSQPHFPFFNNRGFEDRAIEPADGSYAEVIVDFNNITNKTDRLNTFVPNNNSDFEMTRHYYRAPRIVSVDAAQNTVAIRTYERQSVTITVDKFTTSGTNVNGRITQLEDGTFIRGTIRNRVIKDTNDNPLVIDFNNGDCLYSEAEGILFDSIRKINYIRTLVRRSVNYSLTISIPKALNGITVNNLLGRYIVYIPATTNSVAKYIIKYPIDFENFNLNQENPNNSGLTFGLGLDLGSEKDQTWLSAYLQLNTNVWSTLSEMDKNICLHRNNQIPIGIQNKQSVTAARFYWQNENIFDNLNLQNANGNWFNALLRIVTPLTINQVEIMLGTPSQHISFIDAMYCNPLLDILRRNGMVAEPNLIELCVILVLYWQLPTTFSSNNAVIRSAFINAINCHSLVLLRNATLLTVNRVTNNNSRIKIDNFIRHGRFQETDVDVRYLISLNRLEKYYNEIHLNG